MIKRIKAQAEKFKKAQEKLYLEEIQLNVLVEVEMKKHNDEESLHELVDMLPKGYKGSRRIYEAMLRLEDKAKA